MKPSTFKFFLYCIAYLGLMTLQSDNLSAQINSPAKKILNCNYNETRPLPDWINTPPTDKIYYYGVGMAEYKNSMDTQMRMAEIKARNQLTIQIEVILKSDIFNRIREDHTGTSEEHSMQIAQHANAIMKGAEIIDRWKDQSTCIVYVLARIRKELGKSLLKQTSK